MRRFVPHMILWLTLLSPAHATEINISQKGQLFVDAMLAMMEAMGMLNRDRLPAYRDGSLYTDGDYNGSYQPWSGFAPGHGGMPMHGWPGGAGMQPWQYATPWQQTPWSTSPWNNPYGAMTQPWQSMGQMPGQVPGQTMAPRKRHWIEGSWVGSAGERLVVRNGRFRIYVSMTEYRDGRLLIRDHLLYMQDPLSGMVRVYEYAHQHGRLVLRDEDGNLLLFRRES